MKAHTKVILQSALLKSAANLTAQLSRLFRDRNAADPSINWQSVAEFAIFGLIQAQINCHWQRFLEDSLPTRAQAPGEKGDKGTTIWGNVLGKLLLDQTIGLFMMNMVFLICTNAAPLSHPAIILTEVNMRIWSLVQNAWKIWPAFALINFLWVPVESRVLVASCIGFGWNIFLALFALPK